MNETITLLIQLAIPVLLLAIGFFVGTAIEKKHFEELRRREAASVHLPTINFESLPSEWKPARGQLVTGSVVISLDYFKRFLAALRALFGGRIAAYETLLDRARREALLRMKDEAIAAGCNGVINVRLETSRLASRRADGRGVAGIEVLAFGTGVVFGKDAS